MKGNDFDQIISKLLGELVSESRLADAGLKDVAYALKVLSQVTRDAAVMERGFDTPPNWLEKLIEEADADELVMS